MSASMRPVGLSSREPWLLRCARWWRRASCCPPSCTCSCGERHEVAQRRGARVALNAFGGILRGGRARLVRPAGAAGAMASGRTLAAFVVSTTSGGLFGCTRCGAAFRSCSRPGRRSARSCSPGGARRRAPARRQVGLGAWSVAATPDPSRSLAQGFDAGDRMAWGIQGCAGGLRRPAVGPGPRAHPERSDSRSVPAGQREARCSAW